MSLPQISLEISASAVAWYGAVVASLSAGVSIWNACRDRARIKIKFQRDVSVIGKGGIYDTNKTYFNITVTNHGRRSIKISKAALRTFGTKRKYAMLTDSFASHRNQVLTEMEPNTEFFMEQDEKILETAGLICVNDATGKMYRKFIRPWPLVAWWSLRDWAHSFGKQKK